MSKHRTIGVVLLAALVAASPVAAQDTGTVSGTVVDTSGQVVPGATVTLTHERTTTARTATTGTRGEFAFRAVPPGTYTVKIELLGFRTLETRSNVLNANGQLDLGQLKLDVGTVTEVVSVVSEGTVVETRNSDYSGLLTSTQISQIQTKGRDVMSLLRLLPGVKYENDVEAMGDSFGTQVPNIAGNRRAWNQVTVDGLNGNELSGTARFSSAINLDAIAEVKVLLNTYKAEFGRTGRREHPDRQQERRQHLSRHRLLVRPERCLERHAVGEQSHGCRQAEVPLRHVRRQPWRTDSDPRSLRAGWQQEAVFLLLARSAAGSAPGAAAPVSHADRARAPRRLFADSQCGRAADFHQGSFVVWRVQSDSRRARVLCQQRDSARPARSEHTAAAQHAAAPESAGS